ncbi:hypothetical protein ABES03_08595 [Neobacillus rhizosphaerae]|uniref:hypothetical protein n=1 Tax=Neobacillus rhizosphaerae TaxID=2880965 RepID=UPI003D2CE9C7
MLKVIFKPFIFVIPYFYAVLQGVATITAGNSLELVKKFPYHSLIFLVGTYIFFGYKEYKQVKLEKEIEKLKANRLELKKFDIADIPAMMKLIETFPKGEWQVARKLASKISTEYHEQVDMNLLYKALEELAEKGHIEIDHQLGGAISFMRK